MPECVYINVCDTISPAFKAFDNISKHLTLHKLTATAAGSWSHLDRPNMFQTASELQKSIWILIAKPNIS